MCYTVVMENTDTKQIAIFTTAEADYDYTGFSTVEISPRIGVTGSRGFEKVVRCVSVESGHYENYQCGRYGSGMHLVVDAEKIRDYTPDLIRLDYGVALEDVIAKAEAVPIPSERGPEWEMPASGPVETVR